MAPIPGIIQLQGDITNHTIVEKASTSGRYVFSRPPSPCRLFRCLEGKRRISFFRTAHQMVRFLFLATARWHFIRPVTGLHDMDEYLQGQLILAVGAATYVIVLQTSTSEGSQCGHTHSATWRQVCCKDIPRQGLAVLLLENYIYCWQKDISLLYAQLRLFFRDVVVAKPQSSRNSSIGQQSR